MHSDWWMPLQVFGFGAEKRQSISSDLQLLKVGATKPSYYDQPLLPPIPPVSMLTYYVVISLGHKEL